MLRIIYFKNPSFYRSVSSIPTALQDRLKDLSLSDKKIIQLMTPANRPDIAWNRLPQVPVTEENPKPYPPILVISQQPDVKPNSTCDYYFGGLPSLMQAARKLFDDPQSFVMYVNDGRIPKSVLSGHQAHVHPTEWPTPDCRTLNLFKVFLRGIGVLSAPAFHDLHSYTYLHFPISIKKVIQNPIPHLKLYSAFFNERMVQNWYAKQGVSHYDHHLCEMVRDSLTFHEMLSKQIESETGEPTFQRSGRVYWSTDKTGIEHKRNIWKTLGIETAPLSTDAMTQFTLLREDREIVAINVVKDGKFFPETPIRIVNFLKNRFPNRFCTRQATVAEIYNDPQTTTAYQVKEIAPNGTVHTIKVKSLFGSPGHNEVYQVDPLTGLYKQMWNEVPVSGITSLWVCHLSKQELAKRLGLIDPDESLLRKHVRRFLAAANLCNMHITIWDCALNNHDVQLFARVSQGANFNATVADKEDLYNITENLNRFFCGSWEPISVGTCTRKTGLSNVPEYQTGFWYNLSGIGYSASAASFELLQRQLR